MTDPRRLVESCSDEFARSLLSSSRDDVGSSKAYQRTLASLGAGAVVELAAASTASAAVSALAPAAKLGLAGFVKLLSIGAAVGVATVAGVHVATGPAPAPAPKTLPPSERSALAPVSAAPAPLRSPSPAPSAELASTAVRKVPGALAPAASGAEPAPLAGDVLPSEPDPGSRTAAPSALEREVQALDAVKQALARGDAGGALWALAAYEREFSRGALVPEAQVLRVRVSLAAGDREAALAAARRVFDSDPNGRHAAVVRALIARNANP